MSCFFCDKPTKNGIIRCDKCKNATLTSDYSIAKKLEIRENVKDIDNYQRENNISV